MSKQSLTKSPLNVLNEILRKNEMKFSLLNESGEPHCRQFHMKLELNNGEAYVSTGPSIKKSQHAVAQLALVKSTYLSNLMKKDYYKFNNLKNNAKDYIISNLNQAVHKSDISVIYEFADKLKLHLHFQFHRNETGDFVTAECNFDKFHSIGEAHNQSEAKNAACSNMLIILKDNIVNYHAIYDQITNYKRQKIKQKSNSFVEDKMKLNYGRDLSPVSRLMRLCNNNIDKQLNFAITKNSNDFLSTCQFKEFVTYATASNQKLAKIKSAELMLEKFGYSYSK